MKKQNGHTGISVYKRNGKKQPKENGSLLRRLLMIAGCGVLFGGCAAVTFASVFPVMADREENTQQKIELTGSDVAETISEEQATERESVASVSEKRRRVFWQCVRRCIGKC